MPSCNNTKQPSRSLSKQDELLLVQTQYFLKLEDTRLSRRTRCKRFIWNHETNEFMGRTASSWGKILLFYLIFYGMLAALVAICMWAFFQTLNTREPRWQLENSLIGTNPGLGFRPMPETDLESTLIWFKGSNKTEYMTWVDNLMTFLNQYYAPSKIEKGNVPIKRCSYNEPPIRGQVCDVDVRSWGDCSPDVFFNYHRNSPCVFLKLNRIYGWQPEVYNDPDDLPAKMPEQLKYHIGNITKPQERNNVWLTCEGEHKLDQERIGPVEYFPKIQGFPGYYYPYLHSEGYLNPLVAVRFIRPQTGILINVECKAWAKNIKHNRQDRLGSVHFELMID